MTNERKEISRKEVNANIIRLKTANNMNYTLLKKKQKQEQ